MSTQGGFEWMGELGDEVSVQALYAACHALRFSGRLELRDENHDAKVIFLGGDPVEIDGGDTQMIALWGNGQFRAVQSLPNLAGDLTDQLEQTGSLAITQGKRLLAWVSEYRLTCELRIERPGEKAALVFKKGQLESASVNDKPELAALARVQAWTDGFYRVSLRPLFADGMLELRAPPAEGATPGGPREFDLSRSIPLDLLDRAKAASYLPGPVGITTPSIEAEREALRKKSGHNTVDTQPSEQVPERAHLAAPRPARWPIVVAALLVALAGTLAALYALHLPPFSPPPRALEPAVENPDVDKPAVMANPIVADASVAERAVQPPEPIDDPHGSLEPSAATNHALPAQAGADQRLVDRGRLLLVEGHPHSAIELFHKAAQQNPKNPLPKLLEQQALGKLGHAELQLDGKGRVTIDGKRFEAPKKLKLFAGPHAVDTGTGPEELTLKKNEHKKLRIRP